MKTNTVLYNHFALGTPSTAVLWKITLISGVILGFTDHDRDITYQGIVFRASESFRHTAITGNANLSVDNLEVHGVKQDPSLTEEALKKGIWDFARIDIWRVDWRNLDKGHDELRTGYLGEVSTDDQMFSAEMRSLTQLLSQNPVRYFLPTCDAELGDSRCGIDIGPLTVTGSVTGVLDNRIIADTTRTEANNTFTGGKLIWTSGANVGMTEIVKRYTVGVIELQMPTPYNIALTDLYSLKPGCDKYPSTCKDTYNNRINFRGFEFISNTDIVIFAGASK